MTEQQSSYRQIFKATSIFGGVQVFNIIIAIVRSKIVAVLLGPSGMGISGLLISTTSLIGGLTNFGLGTSAIKNVAAAHATGDVKRIAVVVAALRHWVWITGLLGALTTLVLSSWLSEITFGNNEYTLAFVWISITLLFKQLSIGQLVILQGIRKLQYLAKANLLGAILGLVVSIPIYYQWGVDGIVPAIIISSIISMILSWYFSRKVNIENVKIHQQTTLDEGREMLKMGFMLSLSGLISTGAAYLIRIFISNQGGIDEVGLYTAGFAIINTYVGMVFTAMGTDYYPRLSEVAHNNKEACQLINQQAEVAILILAPLLTVFLVFINWMVILLYSSKFLAVTEMIHWAALGMFFKAASWSIAFILLAKAESRIYFWNELIASIYTLSLNIMGYYWGGLNGLGISFLAGYFLYLVQIFFLARIKYSFGFKAEFVKVFGILFLLGLLCFGTVKLFDEVWSYFFGSVFILSTVAFSIKELDQRLGIKSLFIDLRNNKLIFNLLERYGRNKQ